MGLSLRTLEIKSDVRRLFVYREFFTGEGADKILNYYRVLKGAFLCIQKNKRILHYGYIIKQSL